MNADLVYAGQTWPLADGVDRAACQAELMGMLRAGGGIVEFKLDADRTIAVLVAPGVPVAVVDRAESGAVW